MPKNDTVQIELNVWDALSILDVLRLTPIYALLGSEFQDELGESFKPHKWIGYEKEHAEKAAKCHKQFQTALKSAFEKK